MVFKFPPKKIRQLMTNIYLVLIKGSTYSSAIKGYL